MSSRKLVEGWIKYLREDVGETVAEVDSASVEEAGGSWSEIRPADMQSAVNTLSQFLAVKDAPDEVRDALAQVLNALRKAGIK